MRHFDVQLIGGTVLHEGTFRQMKTGEGKTLVGTLPVYLNALTGKGVHVVTVNDYLARRDAEWMGQLYGFLWAFRWSRSCWCWRSTSKSCLRCRHYLRGRTTNLVGFDYLRDNMKFSADDMVQRGHNFAVVDEVDSILVDEARTPLIIGLPKNRLKSITKLTN